MVWMVSYNTITYGAIGALSQRADTLIHVVHELHATVGGRHVGPILLKRVVDLSMTRVMVKALRHVLP